MKQVTFGIIGCGGLANGIFPQLKKARGVKVIAAAARSLSKAQEFAKGRGIEAVGGYKELLKRSDIEAVYIALPEAMHAPVSIMALNAGKHVVCEKTMAPSLKETKAMLAAAKKNKRRLLEAFMYRFHPRNQIMQSEMKKMGAPRQTWSLFTGSMMDRVDNYRLSNKLKGGSLNDIGGYALNVSRFTLGLEAEICFSFEPVRFSEGAQ